MEKRKEAQPTAFKALGLLAIKMANECYLPRATSKEITRNFLIGVDKIKNKELQNADTFTL